MVEWSGVDPADVIARSHEAFVVMDAAGVVRAWNPTASRIFGWSAGEAIGSRLAELIIPERYRSLHERGLRTYLESGVGPVLGTTIEIEGVDRDGRVVPVELTIRETTGDGEPVFHAFLNDVTARRRMERLMRAEARVAWLIADGPAAATLDGVLEAIAQEMDFQVGLAWVPTWPGNVLRLTGRWSGSDAAAAYVDASSRATFERGQGLPGRAWSRGEPIWSTDVAGDPRYVRRAEADRLGLHSGVFLPVGHGAACRGVLEFLTVEWREADEQVLARLRQLSGRLGEHLTVS